MSLLTGNKVKRIQLTNSNQLPAAASSYLSLVGVDAPSWPEAEGTSGISTEWNSRHFPTDKKREWRHGEGHVVTGYSLSLLGSYFWRMSLMINWVVKQVKIRWNSCPLKSDYGTCSSRRDWIWVPVFFHFFLHGIIASDQCQYSPPAANMLMFSTFRLIKSHIACFPVERINK